MLTAMGTKRKHKGQQYGMTEEEEEDQESRELRLKYNQMIIITEGLFMMLINRKQNGISARRI